MGAAGSPAKPTVVLALVIALVAAAQVVNAQAAAKVEVKGSRVHKALPPEVRQEYGFDSGGSAGLFVGVSGFESLSRLEFTVDDAVDLAYLFARELELLTPSKVVLCLAGKPAKEQTSKRLAELKAAGAEVKNGEAGTIYRSLVGQAASATESGMLIVLISTHGFDSEGENYLAASSTVRGYGLLKETSVRSGKVFEIVAGSSAPRKLVLIDACRENTDSGAKSAGGVGLSSALLGALAEASGQAVLLGAQAGGYGFEDPKRQNGVFTCAILDGLRGNAKANDQHLITVQSLASYADEFVAAWVRQHRPESSDTSRGISVCDSDVRSLRMPLAVDQKGYAEARMRDPSLLGKDLVRANAELRELVHANADLRKTALGHLYGTNGLVSLEKARECLEAAHPQDVLSDMWLVYLRAAKSLGGLDDRFLRTSLGEWWREGRGERLLSGVRQLAEGGQPEAIFLLACLRREGVGVDKDEQLAFEGVWAAASKGLDLAAVYLAGPYLDQDSLAAANPQYEEDAWAWLQAAAGRGVAKAQEALGLRYWRGRSLPGPDRAWALKWFRKAAVRDLATAWWNLYWVYSDGIEGRPMLEKAVECLERLDASGDTEAEYKIAGHYLQGRGVNKVPAIAISRYKGCARRGHVPAQIDLGRIYKQGRVIGVNWEESARWYRMAASEGDATAQYELGQLYEWGKLGEESEARTWYRRAAEQGHEEAMVALESLDGPKKD